MKGEAAASGSKARVEYLMMGEGVRATVLPRLLYTASVKKRTNGQEMGEGDVGWVSGAGGQAVAMVMELSYSPDLGLAVIGARIKAAAHDA